MERKTPTTRAKRMLERIRPMKDWIADLEPAERERLTLAFGSPEAFYRLTVARIENPAPRTIRVKARPSRQER